MPNQKKADKRVLSVLVKRELYMKLAVAAEKYDLPISTIVQRVLEDSTQDIELTPEHYEQIAKEIRQAQAGTSTPRSSYRKPPARKRED